MDDLIEKLEPRFSEPDGWRWHHFKRNGKTYRYGFVFPKDNVPDAIVIGLQGVREFTEKYFETARWCLDHNFAFGMMDWAGQGKSTRFIEGSQKRHAQDFAQDIEDLRFFINEFIERAGIDNNSDHIPKAMLAHSMGANIGLRYIQKYPDTFECAAFSAPMIGLKVFSHLPQSLALKITRMANRFYEKKYRPMGQDWTDELPPPAFALTGDPIRQKVHNIWCAHDPALRCGDITFGWLYEAQKTCIFVQNPAFGKSIKTPCLFGLPLHEHLVDNKKSEKFIQSIENSEKIIYPNSYHEILMEKNEIRDDFLSKFYDIILQNIMNQPQSLKPF